MTATAHVSAYTGDINDWALETKTFGPYAAATLVQNTSYGLFMITQPCDIEKITVRAGTRSTAASEITFKIDAPGTAFGAGTAITAAEVLSSANLAAVDTPYDLPFLSTAPQINVATGSLFSVTVSNTAATTGLAAFFITVTLRKKPDRRDNTSDTTKVDKTKYFYTKN